MTSSDADLYEAPLLHRMAWPQLATLGGIALAALAPLLLALALAA